MVLTKEELEDQDWWNQNVVFTEKNPADGVGTLLVFGSVRSPVNANLRLSVCSVKVCLELSIFILKQSGSVPGQS